MQSRTWVTNNVMVVTTLQSYNDWRPSTNTALLLGVKGLLLVHFSMIFLQIKVRPDFFPCRPLLW